MLSARDLVVLFGACLISGAGFAQDTKPAFEPQPAAKPTASETANPPLTPEGRGDVFMARKMYREAIESYEQAPQNSAIVWNKLGIAYHQMMQLDAAMKRYRHAIRLDRKYPEAINNLGTVYYAEKNYGRASSCYKRALKLAPNAASIYSNLGTAYFAQKRYKQAWEAYNTAFQLDPEVFEHRSTYGVLLQERTTTWPKFTPAKARRIARWSTSGRRWKRASPTARSCCRIRSSPPCATCRSSRSCSNWSRGSSEAFSDRRSAFSGRLSAGRYRGPAGMPHCLHPPRRPTASTRSRRTPF